MKYLYIVLITIFVVSCSKEVFPGEHADETVSILLTDSEGKGFGTSIATSTGDRKSSARGSTPDFNGEIFFAIKSVSDNDFILSYSVKLDSSDKKMNPMNGEVTVKYNEPSFVELDHDFKLRILSHEGDVDPNELN